MYKPSDLINNQYEVRQCFRGGMGYVYIVHDQVSERSFAIKMLKDEFLQESSAVARFEREAKNWINLGAHENIVRAISFQRGAHPLLILEYVEGLNLQQVIQGEPAGLCLPQVTAFAIQIGIGLRFAHSCDVGSAKSGVIHRDLKPANVMVNMKGTAKITDFGLARAQDDTSLTGTNPMGTLPYMPPEQWRDARRVTEGADIYSFGVVMYQMLTGTLPFPGRTAPEIMHQVFNVTPTPISELRENVPVDLVDLVTDCMHRECKDRPESMGSVVSALEEMHATLVDSATSETSCWNCGYMGNREQLRCPVCASTRRKKSESSPQTSMRQCCDLVIPEDHEFCIHCGKKYEAHKTCTACGADTPHGFHFCANCGTKL